MVTVSVWPFVFPVHNNNYSVAVEACLACCAVCFVGCIENLVEYFNRCVNHFTLLTFKNSSSPSPLTDMRTLKSVSCVRSVPNCIPELIVASALYGKRYIEAAKDTWRLFKDRGTSFLYQFYQLLISYLGIDAIVNDSLVGMSKAGFWNLHSTPHQLYL